VYVDSNAAFTMNGGTISGNTATKNGGGVYFTGTTFTMSGGARVDAGNIVYLASGKVITLSGALTANPAANIQPNNTAAGTQLLMNNANLSAGTPPNYLRFLVSNTAGKIGSDGKYTGP
jgi:hypothetical protein